MSSKDVTDKLAVLYGDNVRKRTFSNMFPGGFMNAGYWRGIPITDVISTEGRIESQRALYRLVLERVRLQRGDILLEVAAGRGRGCVLALTEFEAGEVHGVDIMPDQIERARSENDDVICRYPGRLVFQLGSASKLPYANDTFSKIVSLEAALYFSDLGQFARELHRVARKPARVAIACFFSTPPSKNASDWIHLFDKTGVGYAHSVSDLEQALSGHGFEDVQAVSIGEHVWEGWRNWEQQQSPDSFLARQHYSGYQQGVFDYYVVTANVNG